MAIRSAAKPGRASSQTRGSPNQVERGWTFFTNHAHVLFLLTSDPDILLRDIAQRVGITERAVQKILAELVEADYVTVERRGRTNHYRLFLNRPLRHPIERHRTIGDVVKVLALGQVKI